MKELNKFRQFINEGEGSFSKEEVLKMKEDLKKFLDTYGYIMAPVDKSKAFDVTSALDRLAQKVEDQYPSTKMEELNTFREFLNENPREVKVTDEHRAEMLRVAQDLHNIVKTHHEADGTRLLRGKMDVRDELTGAARTLEFLAKFN